MKLRPYQFKCEEDIYAQWARGYRNVLAVLPTGAGKTVVFSEIIKKNKGPSCAITHRQELVTQISLALARDGVRHRIIGPKSVVKQAVALHMEDLGRSYYDPGASCAVAGVMTLTRRPKELEKWLDTVTLVVMDEAHHVLRENQWGKAIRMFKNAKVLGVTATPERADGKGLGLHADGIFEVMTEGPTMRELITQGYLTDYRIFVPPSDLDLATVSLSQATGDYNPNKLKAAIRKSHVVGDVVKHYLKIAPGKLGVTFASDVETATDMAEEYRLAGVPAQVVHAKTSTQDRISALRRFKNREILQLVNVDLFGEGFDLPAIEVVSMARPTQSYALYAQQFGRALRILEGKTEAIIIDHVGNCIRHGLPDVARVWSLDRRERRSRQAPDDVIPNRPCLNPECMALYERIYPACPYCGHKPVPAARSGPEFVDGDLTELDAATLAAMRGEVAKVDRTEGEVLADMQSRHVPHIGQLAGINRHRKLQAAQEALRGSIAQWAGYQRAANRPDSERYRRFYHMFGVDVLSAQALNTKDAEVLTARINKEIST